MLFFASRDDATTDVATAPAPGMAARDPAAHTADLQRGNVVLLAADDARFEGARALAERTAGPATAALREAGQAVLVASGGAPGMITALAHGRSLQAPSADDPELMRFVEYWLGRAAG